MDLTNYKQVYLCGDMLHKSLFEYRKKQKEQLEGIEGITVFNPSSQEFNNKKETNNHKLAERIVESDSYAIDNSDIYVIDLPTGDAGGRGTVAEIGQIYQAKRQAKELINNLESMYGKDYADVYDIVQDIVEQQEKIINKPVLVYSDDIRWNTSDMNDDMDRVPYSFNAYTYGLVLDITNGKGVISWEEVLKELERLGEGG